MKIKDYIQIKGFEDLREWEIPVKEFIKFWKIQSYLYKCQENYEKGLFKEMSNKLIEAKNLSAEYQQALFSYEKKQLKLF